MTSMTLRAPVPAPPHILRALRIFGPHPWIDSAACLPRVGSQNCEGEGLCERAANLFGDGE